MSMGGRDKDSLQTDSHAQQPPSLLSHETPRVAQESQESGSALKTGSTSCPTTFICILSVLSL